jgi:predicted enzyme related to lactoylglutathione lyase
MKRVTGIGGVFFKCEDPAATKAWYEKHLGIPASDWGHAFEWKDSGGDAGTTTWSPFSATSKYFGPSDQVFMINYRVADLKGLLEVLQTEGVEIAGEMQEFDYGKFGWIVDCDGRRIELWEPIDQPLVDFQA